MNTNSLKIVAIVLLLVGNFSSCATENEDIFSEPIDIPITEYSLNGTGCWWSTYEHEKIAVINSNKELEKHVVCSDGFSYPAIDFSKHTLLLACGCNNYGIASIVVCLQQYSSQKYVLNVEITSNDATVIQPWAIGYITDTSVKNAKVELNITIIKN